MLTESREPTWLTVLRLLRWDKPAGRLILMIPALWAVFLAAHGMPPIPLVEVIVFGTLATSAAGCVVNDLWDRNIDPQVERTRNRPIAARSISVGVGIAIALIAFLCAWVIAAYLNPLSYWLCVAAVPFIIFYPAAKRVFPVPQLVLSIAWGFGVLISWSAVTGNLEPATWALWGATVFWTLGFDTVYAMSDREDDRKLGVKSSALFFGDRAAEAVGVFFAATVILLGLSGYELGLNWAFWLSLLGGAIAWAYHYRELSQSDLDRSIYGRIFQQNVWIGFVLLAGMIAGCF